MSQDPRLPPGRSRLWRRLLSGFTLAMAIALSVFFLMSASQSGSVWFASLWFLALLPAVLCALICYIGDPHRNRSTTFYLLVPLVLTGLVCLASFFILQEGIICTLMLSPIWIGSGWAGAFLMRSQRRRRGRTIQSSFLIIPLLAGVVEAQIPVPNEAVTVSRSILIMAPPEDIWTYAVSSRDITPAEGRWTITHNLIGMPRPRESITIGTGPGAVRTAYWGDNIDFQEHITTWQPGRELGWRFHFPNTSVQDNTDRHVSPDGEFLTIHSGDYVIRRVSADTTELTLTTRYIARTHVNLYARLWGELMMGDIQDNVLTIIKHRSEATSGA